MNEAINNILTRKSIRAFKDTPVPQEFVEQIIACGMAAPSSKNSRPWKFKVLQDKKILSELGNILINSQNLDTEPCDPDTGKIKAGVLTSIKASGVIITKSPLVVVIENTCPFSGGRKKVMAGKFKDRAIGGHDSEFLSLGAAMENISLAAHALGLGSVIMADVIAEEEKIKQLLGFEGDLVCAICIGYPAYF